jgi:teneurin
MKQRTIGNEERMRTECPANCSRKGECIEGECRCQWGWTGADCGKKDCPFGCDKHGKCGEDGKCECTNGWSGENCQIGLELAFGNSIQFYSELCMKNCSQMGQCLLRADGWHCECQKGQFGENCEFGWESNCEDGIDNDEGKRNKALESEEFYWKIFYFLINF